MLKAIIVDDHPASRTFLNHVLKGTGIDTQLVGTAAEALEAFEREPIDIWFVDWVMPGMNGLELVRSIRKQPRGERPYIIMLTAKGSEEDLATAFEAGVDDFIAKPVGALELQARMKAATRLVTLNGDLRARLDEINGLNRQLAIAASTDALTGLLNRRAGLDKLRAIWDECTPKGTPLSVALVDIDEFKRVNDRFGHARGDAAIRHIASVLRDTAEEPAITARIGGEEFMIALPGVDAGVAGEMLDSARQRVARARCIADGHTVPLSISAGVADRDAGTSSAEELVRLADTALYQAKQSGRNKVVAAAALVGTGAPMDRRSGSRAHRFDDEQAGQ